MANRPCYPVVAGDVGGDALQQLGEVRADVPSVGRHVLRREPDLPDPLLDGPLDPLPYCRWPVAEERPTGQLRLAEGAGGEAAA